MTAMITPQQESLDPVSPPIENHPPIWYVRAAVMLLIDGARFFVSTVLIVALVATTIALLLPEEFTSTTVVLPTTEKNKLSSLGAMGDLAALAGINLGETDLSKLYPQMVRSESILRPAILSAYISPLRPDTVSLIEFWKIDEGSSGKDIEMALKRLREDLSVTIDAKTSIVTMSIETRDPYISAAILSNVSSELDRFLRTKRITNASQQRRWIETRLSEVQVALTVSEDSLTEFRNRNRIVAGSPTLLLQQERMIREVQINGTLFTELKKQYELARIEEIKNIPIVNILDPARPAAKRSFPKRTQLVLSASFIGLVLSAFWLWLNRYHASLLQDLGSLARDVRRSRFFEGRMRDRWAGR